jgi:hypothetical protein
MLSSEYLPQAVKTALRKGRAIPMLVDFRHDEIPDHTFTVIGLIDTRSFQAVLLPDNFSDEKLVSLVMPEVNVSVAKIKVDSADAEAIHELWSGWTSGVCQIYMDFVQTIARALSDCKFSQALEHAQVVDLPKQASEDKPRTKRRQAKKPKAPRKARVTR